MKKVLIPVLVIVLAAGGYAYYSQNKAAVEQTHLTLYGNVDIRDVALGFRVYGRIAQMRVEEGDRVEKGTVLAVLEKEPILNDLALAEAELSEAKAVAANALTVYRRRAQLAKSNAISRDLLDEALANKNVAQARKLRAEARVDLMKTRLADTEIRAPNNGIILTRVREPGAIVKEGATVYTLALSHPVWVRTYVDEPHLGHVYPGQKARVLTDTGGAYEGQVGFISPQVEFTPKNVETTQLRTSLVYRLRVIVKEPDTGLRQGMPVTVEMDLSQQG